MCFFLREMLTAIEICLHLPVAGGTQQFPPSISSTQFCSPALTKLRNFKPLFFWGLFRLFHARLQERIEPCRVSNYYLLELLNMKTHCIQVLLDYYKGSSLDHLICPMLLNWLVWATCHKQTKAVSAVYGPFIPIQLLLSGFFPVEPASLLPHVNCLQHFCVVLPFCEPYVFTSSLFSTSVAMSHFVDGIITYPCQPIATLPKYWHAASCTVFLADHFLPV